MKNEILDYECPVCGRPCGVDRVDFATNDPNIDGMIYVSDCCQEPFEPNTEMYTIDSNVITNHDHGMK